MNPISPFPRIPDAPLPFTPVAPGLQPSGPVAPIHFNAGTPGRAQPASITIISSGEWPFDQATLEAPHARPQAPFNAIYCNQLPGATSIDRGHALLAEVARRRASGDIGPQTLVVLMLHGAVLNGELVLGDGEASMFLPATVLLNTLACGSRGNDDTRPVAPIVLSACHAEWCAEALGRLERPVLINGSRHSLVPGDAQAVLQACVLHADNCWREGRAVQADSLFETLSSVSAEPLHLRHRDEWTAHRLLESSASLHDIDPRQAGLHVDAMLDHGSVDELAESLLLFGIDAHRRISPSIPALHRVVDGCDADAMEKIQLLLAIGEDVNQIDDDGDTALHRACQFDPNRLSDEALEKELVLRHGLARLLLENGADPDIENDDSMSPADLADEIGQPLAGLFALDASIEARPEQRTQWLRNTAGQRGWESVLSLLDDPQQAMTVDDDEQASTADAATPDQIIEKSDS